MYGEVKVQLHVNLTSALDGGEWSASRSDRITTRKKIYSVRIARRFDGPLSQFGLCGEEKCNFFT
jgi:hypothetical protein